VAAQTAHRGHSLRDDLLDAGSGRIPGDHQGRLVAEQGLDLVTCLNTEVARLAAGGTSAPRAGHD
jgi:hypothetical protein